MMLRTELTSSPCPKGVALSDAWAMSIKPHTFDGNDKLYAKSIRHRDKCVQCLQFTYTWADFTTKRMLKRQLRLLQKAV